MEAPSKPGRPAFSFSFESRKNFPSKWDNSEKWVINGHQSPSHTFVKSSNFAPKQQETHEKAATLSDKVERVTMASFLFQGPKVASVDHNTTFKGVSPTSNVFLKDKFTEEAEPLEVHQDAKNRDTGTEMTPIGSSTTSRCPTPLKSRSPPRHNTPETKLGPSGLTGRRDIGELHLGKLQPWTLYDAISSKWSSKEDEEDDISKSLRQFEMDISGPRSSAWEEKEKCEPCIRYQMLEAKIQAWVNLQKAKAEAESRKLEVKIQKMRSKCEEKLMKKMTLVDRKAEELRAAAQLEHSEQVRKMSTKSNDRRNLDQSAHFSGNRGSCVYFIRK